MQCSEAMLIMSQCYLFKDCQYMSIKYDLHETCVCFRYIDNECNIKRDLFITVSMSCAAFLPVVFLTKVPAEHASFEGLSEPEFDKTMEVKTSINVLNTLEVSSSMTLIIPWSLKRRAQCQRCLKIWALEVGVRRKLKMT